MLEHVERLNKNGVAVHLLKKKSKAPVNNKWSELPVPTFAELKAQYRDGMNVGARLGKWSKVHGLYLLVIDVDIRDPETTAEAFDELANYFPGYMDFPEVQSGSMTASRHFYIFTDKPFPSKKFAHSDGFTMVFDAEKDREVKKWDWELELFGTGKQVAIPPSIHPITDKAYRWISPIDFTDIKLGDSPAIIPSEDIRERVFNGNQSKTDIDPNDERIKPIGITLERAAEVISKLPKDEWIEDRDGWLRLGMGIHHEFAGSVEARTLWADCSKQSKKFDKKDLIRVWKSFKNKHRPFRMASIMSVIREIELKEEFLNLSDDGDDMDVKKKRTRADDLLGNMGDDDEPEYLDLGEDEDGEIEGTRRAQKIRKANVEAELGNVPPKVARLNKEHACISINGKTVILWEYSNGNVAYGNISDFNNYYENDRVATEKATEPVSKAWLRHKKRRNYRQGVEFSPNRATPGAYNLWRGWSVVPDPNENPKQRCKLFLKHLKNVVARGDEAGNRYLLGWLAHMVQKPEDKPGVAVVIKGKKGAGKDTIAEYFSEILKHHYIMISQRKHLVGNFNAHQEKIMFLHVEEGYWAGSKQDEGPLKSIITSPTVTIERKGIDAIKVNSVLRIFMTSNEDWVVPASGQDERRYFVAEADDAWTRSGRFGRVAADRKKYFDALRHEMTHGGREALLAYLMEYDLSEFDVRDPPATEALDEQKVAGLTGVDRWWADQLMGGELEFHGFDLSYTDQVDWSNEAIQASSANVYEAYADWARRQRYGNGTLSNVAFFLRLKKIAPLLKIRRRVDGERAIICQIGSLNQCRDFFDKHLGSHLAWQNYDFAEDADDIEAGDDMD